MLKFSKKAKILFVLLIIFLFIQSFVLATDINMNLPTEDSTLNAVDGNNIDNMQDANTTSTNEVSQITDDIGGSAAPSSVSSIAQENMSFSNILNILLITVGVVLILLAIAILIRLKS